MKGGCYVAGFEESSWTRWAASEAATPGREALHDAKFKLCDEVARLHVMGERVTPLSEEEEASRFAEKLPPGKTVEELGSIAAFERDSWAEYLAETEADRHI